MARTKEVLRIEIPVGACIQTGRKDTRLRYVVGLLYKEQDLCSQYPLEDHVSFAVFDFDTEGHERLGVLG